MQVNDKMKCPNIQRFLPVFFGISLRFYVGKGLSGCHETYITRKPMGFPSPMVHQLDNILYI